jgi:Homeodomain-like domain
MLMLADGGLTDEEIARAQHGSVSTVERVRKRFVEEGLEVALSERPRPGARRKLDGRQEAYLLALASSDPPEGKKHWSMQLCWPADLWSLRSWRRSRTRRSDARSKRGRQTVVEETGVHPRGRRGVCVAYGRRSGSLRGALRFQRAADLL